jgi:hypothetical protein
LAEVAKSNGDGDGDGALPTPELVRLLEDDPGLAAGRVADRDGYTLLHHAVRMTSSAAVLRRLANPSSLARQNRRKRTALHQACGFGRPSHVVALLAESHPPALEVPDEYGLVPLHYACWRGADASTVLRLIEARPGAVRAVSREGETPLYSACECESGRLTGAVFGALVRNWPVAAAILHTTDDGRASFPLQRAVRRGGRCGPDAVRHLRDASVRALVAVAQCGLHECSSAPEPARRFLRAAVVPYFADSDRADNTSNPFALVRGLQANVLARDASGATCGSNDALLKLLEVVFRETSIQAMVRDAAFQAMICGLVEMNEAISHSRDVDRHGNSAPILMASINNLDCLFLCLRECPNLVLGGA